MTVTPDSQNPAVQLGQIVDIMFGAVFLFVGLAACFIAAVRRRGGVRVFVWLGIWSGMYGLIQMSQSPPLLTVLPHWLQTSAPYANTAATYLILVAASLCFRELSLGKVRSLTQLIAIVALAIGLAGVAFFVFTGSNDKLMPYNNLLAACLLILLLVVVASPKLSSQYLVLTNRGVFAFGTMVFAVEALFVNMTRPLGFESALILDHLGFATLLFSFGYVAVQVSLAGERRLLAIENELEIARQLQFSILPDDIPELLGVRVAAAYRPMTAVGGDFYDFIPLDAHRAGFLIADVSGHGVPAALIASMIKVAMQSVAAWAHDPSEVLRRLGTILSDRRGQFVSAAYLWIDTETGSGRYSAAGHPPLLYWRATDRNLIRIESNGLLFGVMPASAYPSRSIPLASGDRFLLYTDGMVEPENSAGESFGDHQLERIVRENQSRPAPELCERLLAGVQQWQASSTPQQDDITLVVIDFL